MTTPEERSDEVKVARARAGRLGASLMMLGACAGVGASALGAGLGRALPWQALAVPMALYGVGAIGFARRDALSQVLARGAVAAFAGPALLAVALKVIVGHGRSPLDFPLLALGASGALAIGLAHQTLHTGEARARFSPTRFRQTWLTSATIATASVALSVVVLALQAGHPLGLGLVAMQCCALTFAIAGVLRMRGWGVVLAAANATFGLLAAALGSALVSGLSVVSLLASVSLVLPVVLARLFPGSARNHPAAHAAIHEPGSVVEPRLRVASEAPDARPAAADALPADDDLEVVHATRARA